MIRPLVVALFLVLATRPGPMASAQAVPAAPAARTDSAKPIADAQLFHRSDLYVLGGFAAATIALFPLDKHLASVVRDEDLVTNRTLRSMSSGLRFFGSPGPLLIGPAMYVVGRAAHVPRMAELAVHGTEAVLVGSAVAGVLKFAAGRARPYTSADTNPRNFAFGRGLSKDRYRSFPSGHSTAAFAAAAAVTAETSQWWPRYKILIGTTMYGGAALVGISRIYDDQHWASDVMMGAAIGTFAGLKTVRFNHTHSGNRLDRWLLGGASEAAAHLEFLPRADGAALVWVSRVGGAR